MVKHSTDSLATKVRFHLSLNSIFEIAQVEPLYIEKAEEHFLKQWISGF